MATLAPQIGPDGIIAPSYADILAQLKNLYWSIYGSDANLDADTQDGQWVAVQAQAIYECGQTAVAVYNSFSPSTAQGAGLSSVVKINGIAREVPTNSEAIVTITGQAGTTINAGIIGDSLGLGTQWNLPSVVVIPVSGTIDVTATAVDLGDITAGTGTLTVIITPTRGWQNVTNPAAATPGEPVETDAQLRQRQTSSVSLPALTVNESIFGSLDGLPGVSRVALYENDGDATDANTVPPHSICIVIEGGDVTQIVDTIALKKTPGTGTYGDISQVVIDQNGVPDTIRFFQLSVVPLTVEIDIKPLVGYTDVIGAELEANVIAFVNALLIGEESYLSRLYTPANVGSVGDGATFVVRAIRQSRDGNPPAAANVPISFKEAASLIIDDVTLTVIP